MARRKDKGNADLDHFSPSISLRISSRCTRASSFARARCASIWARFASCSSAAAYQTRGNKLVSRIFLWKDESHQPRVPAYSTYLTLTTPSTW